MCPGPDHAGVGDVCAPVPAIERALGLGRTQLCWVVWLAGLFALFVCGCLIDVQRSVERIIPVAQSVHYPRSAAQNEQLFSNETFATLEEFDCMGTYVDFAPGEVLFREGQSCGCVYVISSGQVKLWADRRGGRRQIVAISGRGELLGLSAALTEGIYEVTAEATGYCRVRAIRKESVLKLLEANPAACMRAMQAVIRDQSSLWLNLRRLGFPISARGRVASLLLDWVRQQTPEGSAQTRCVIPLTHREIASMSATTRESVSRIITRLRHDKVIAVRGVALTVLNQQALEEFCGL